MEKLTTVNRLKNKTINNLIQINQLKNRKMNKLIMGLSCLGVLSMVSCDNNEHSEKVAPSLEKVSFSAASSDDSITLKAGDKVILKIVDKNGNVIKYYTDADRITGTEFPDAGQEFTFNADGTIKNGLFIEASSDDYSIVKFNLTDVNGNKKYEIKAPVSLTVTKGSKASATVALVEKKEGTVTGVDDKGESVSFSTSDVTSTISPFSFMVQFKVAGSSDLLNSKTDGDTASDKDYYKISFVVKDDNNSEIYKVEDLFKKTGIAGDSKGFSTFTITLNREIAHYTNLTISGSIQKGSTSAKTIADKKITSTDKLITLQSSL